MKKRTILSLLLVMGALCLLCTACSTSAFDNAESYRREVGGVLRTWLSSPSRPSGSNSGEESDITRLAAPGDFTLSENGDYCFTGVADADYYLLYFCATDATDDKDAFLFSSNSIPAVGTGSETYSGNVDDLVQYGYGEYLVKVFAFPNMNDTQHSMSTAATADFSCSGAQDAPVIDYLWNTFEQTVDIQLTNINDYTYQAYPDTVEVTFTNVEDNSDSVVVALEALSPNNNSVKSDALTPGTSYRISAVSHNASSYVTNADSDVTVVAESVTFAGHNVMSVDYNYTDGIARDSFNYPQVMKNVSLTESCEYDQHVLAFGTPATYTFTTTPIAANPGSSYTFNVTWNGFMSFDDAELELYPDGTFQFNQYSEMPPQGPSSMRGIWTDNGDGTVTMSYDHSTLTTSVG
ncbi:MAG: hypothetical protein HDT33_07280 [Clostridiales bacterium]|nr:hypothetical protein [Clostridiales bacterium]